jgi:hypothetical protein
MGRAFRVGPARMGLYSVVLGQKSKPVGRPGPARLTGRVQTGRAQTGSDWAGPCRPFGHSCLAVKRKRRRAPRACPRWSLAAVRALPRAGRYGALSRPSGRNRLTWRDRWAGTSLWQFLRGPNSPQVGPSSPFWLLVRICDLC